VLPKKVWPAVEFKEKRAITLTEHLAIVTRENNPERKAFYKLAWYLGASQSDLAFLNAEDVDWERNVISYQRMKTGTVAIMRMDKDMEEILRDFASGFRRRHGESVLLRLRSSRLSACAPLATRRTADRSVPLANAVA
jgi:integrase